MNADGRGSETKCKTLSLISLMILICSDKSRAGRNIPKKSSYLISENQ